MENRERTSLVVFVGMIVNSEHAERDFRLSIAGNNFQSKFLSALAPNIFVNIVPPFLRSEGMAEDFLKCGLVLNSRFRGPFLLRSVAQMVADGWRFVFFLRKKRRLKIFFYNLDYLNMPLVLIARVFGHQTYAVAADYTNPPRTFYDWVVLRLYARLNGVIALRATRSLNDNVLLLPAILDDDDTCRVSVHDENSVLFSGSLGETTGLDVLIRLAVECPTLQFYLCGRPFHLSLSDLHSRIRRAVSLGAKISYLGMLSREDYKDLLGRVTITLSLRDPKDPDHQNNFPSKIVEYMSAGKVVVSSLEYSELPSDTYLHVGYDPKMIAQALLRIIENTSLRESMAVRARLFVSENFSSAVVSRKIREFSLAN